MTARSTTQCIFQSTSFENAERQKLQIFFVLVDKEFADNRNFSTNWLSELLVIAPLEKSLDIQEHSTTWFSDNFPVLDESRAEKLVS